MPATRSFQHPVRALRDGDLDACAIALSLAFAEDPVYRYMHPAPGEWERVAPRFFRILLRHFSAHATVLTTGAAGAAAIWTPPEPQGPGRFARLAFTLRLGALLGRRMPRGARIGAALDSLHCEEPHWYLAILGTAPANRGRGIASSLLAPILARCDAAGLPARLETATEANLGFYRAHGFAVVGEAQVAGGGPRLWALQRSPASGVTEPA
jgi:ribosomal protein S18 acetylase RimI-like enzyme